MISRHCGVRLIRLDLGYMEDCATLRRYHEWKCPVCQVHFEQTMRLSAKVKADIAARLAKRK